MKMAVVLGLALTLSAQPIEAPLLTAGHLNGHWWVQASRHDRQIYQMAFADGGGTIKNLEAIDRFYSNPQELDVSLEKGIRTIWGSADKVARPSTPALEVTTRFAQHR
jgi:hypothetical protein